MCIAVSGIAAKTDAENLLSLRVLLQSIKPLEYPFVVLAADTVAERSLMLLRHAGATVVKVRNGYIYLCDTILLSSRRPHANAIPPP